MFYQKSEVKEKKEHNIAKKSLAQTSAQLKQIAEHEKKVKSTLDLISELKETRLVDAKKLDHISRLLKAGKNVEEIDKQYLQEKARDLNQVIDCKTKVTWMLDTIMKLQEYEIRRYKKLEAISQAVEQGKLVSEREMSFLNSYYEKLQSARNEQKKLEWTMQTIEKLKQSGMGDVKKLDNIKQLLEDEIPVPENDIKYLKEEYRLLSQIPDQINKIEQIVNMINELQEMEIGNPEKLRAIKKILEEGKTLSESEISYIEQKHRLLMTVKKSNKEYETTSDKNKTKELINSILNELDTFSELYNLTEKHGQNEQEMIRRLREYVEILQTKASTQIA